jgi:hypothetical protein
MCRFQPQHSMAPPGPSRIASRCVGGTKKIELISPAQRDVPPGFERKEGARDKEARKDIFATLQFSAAELELMDIRQRVIDSSPFLLHLVNQLCTP